MSQTSEEYKILARETLHRLTNYALHRQCLSVQEWKVLAVRDFPELVAAVGERGFAATIEISRRGARGRQ